MLLSTLFKDGHTITVSDEGELGLESAKIRVSKLEFFDNFLRKTLGEIGVYYDCMGNPVFRKALKEKETLIRSDDFLESQLTDDFLKTSLTEMLGAYADSLIEEEEEIK